MHAKILLGMSYNEAYVRNTLAHEVFGHASLAYWQRDGHDVNGMLRWFAQRRPDLVQERAKIYRYTPAQKVWGAEEVLARIAGYEPELSWLDAALASHRTWLRSNVLPGLYLSDREIIRNYILPMRRTMTEANS